MQLVPAGLIGVSKPGYFPREHIDKRWKTRVWLAQPREGVGSPAACHPPDVPHGDTPKPAAMCPSVPRPEVHAGPQFRVTAASAGVRDGRPGCSLLSRPHCACVLNHRPRGLRCVDGRKQIATQALETARGARAPEGREVREAAQGRKAGSWCHGDPSSLCPRCCPRRGGDAAGWPK